MHAVGRLALHPHVENVQVSWVKAGPQGVVEALHAGVNDLGGTLMNESISRAAGAGWGQELSPEQMEALIRSAGRVPRQRTTLYGTPPPEQVARSFARRAACAALEPARERGEARRPRRSCARSRSPERGSASGGARSRRGWPRLEPAIGSASSASRSSIVSRRRITRALAVARRARPPAAAARCRSSSSRACRRRSPARRGCRRGGARAARPARSAGRPTRSACRRRCTAPRGGSSARLASSAV